MEIVVLYKDNEGHMQADYYRPSHGPLYVVSAQRRFDFLASLGYEMHSLRPQANVRRTFAGRVKVGQWIVGKPGGFDVRVVGISHGPLDYQVKVEHDYGNGGEPATSFYWNVDPVTVFTPA